MGPARFRYTTNTNLPPRAKGASLDGMRMLACLSYQRTKDAASGSLDGTITTDGSKRQAGYRHPLRVFADKIRLNLFKVVGQNSVGIGIGPHSGSDVEHCGIDTNATRIGPWSPGTIADPLHPMEYRLPDNNGCHSYSHRRNKHEPPANASARPPAWLIVENILLVICHLYQFSTSAGRRCVTITASPEHLSVLC